MRERWHGCWVGEGFGPDLPDLADGLVSDLIER